MSCFVSPVVRAFKNGSRAKILELTKKPKYHREIIDYLNEFEKETEGFFVDVIMQVILVGPLTKPLIQSMIDVFTGRYVDEDKMGQYHEKLNQCGIILAKFGTIRGCLLAIQIMNTLFGNFPSETKEALTHALLNDEPKSSEDRWMFRIVQGYLIQ